MMRPLGRITTVAAALCWLTFTVSASSSSQMTFTTTNSDGTKTFESLTKPLPLYPGEVTNTWHTIAIPPGPIAISEFAADIVELDESGNNIVPVLLSEAYLHHHVVYSKHDYHKKNWWNRRSSSSATTQRSIGFGAGTESRGTRQVFPAPYRFTTVQGESELLANVHVINTRTMTVDQAHHCLECPCTGEDRDFTQGNRGGGFFHWLFHGSTPASKYNTTLKAEVVERTHWDHCNAQLTSHNNTACSPSTYYGGLICCEHGEFCLDDYYLDASLFPNPNKRTGVRSPARWVHNETQSTFYLRYTLTYQEINRQNQDTIIPLYLASCCDASGNMTSHGNIEYDIPKLCSTVGDASPQCVHTLETVQTLHGASNGVFGTGDISTTTTTTSTVEQWVDVVYMVGHLHRGGIEMSAYFADNNTLICKSVPSYGDGTAGEIGNEPGYINSMSTCTFNPPKRMKTTERIKVVGKYNATEAHTGVMSLFYIAVADVEGDGTAATTTTITTANTVITERVGFWKRFQKFASFVGFCIVAFATYQVFTKRGVSVGFRQGYEQVPSTATSLTV